MLDDLFDYCFPILDKIAHKLDVDRGRDVRGPLARGRPRHLQRQAGDHLLPQDHQARALDAPRCSSAASKNFLPEELEDYFDDIVDSAERIWDLLDNYKEVVDGLESTNESVLSHRQNDVLRLLTVISVTILPLTLVTGLFGMNVLFPGEGTREAFWAIVVASLSRHASSGPPTLGFFRWRGWL